MNQEYIARVLDVCMIKTYFPYSTNCIIYKQDFKTVKLI